MEDLAKAEYNRLLRDRTLTMAVNVYDFLLKKKNIYLNRPMIVQLARSSSSVAANCRAALRARSDAEFYSKICIVVEECDETQFWFDYLLKIKFIKSEEVMDLLSEVNQLVRIFTTIKKKMKEKVRLKFQEKNQTPI